jgi:RHS repeat-associated protein
MKLTARIIVLALASIISGLQLPALAQADTLSVSKSGSGSGTVTSSPAGIACGATCSTAYATGTVVTLTAMPAADSTFGGWSGACTGTAPTCSVTLSQAQAINATFSAPAVTHFQYDPNGNLTQITDPLGRIRQHQYDALDQPVRQLEPHPTLIGSTQGQIDTTYDSLGQLTSVTDPRNLTTQYQVDSLGNLTSQISPDTGTTSFTYDAAGNVKTRTNARSKTAVYSYDSLNRITQAVYDSQTVTYTWDNCPNGIGRLCSLANNADTVSYSYDSQGRITGKTQSVSTNTLTASYSYNTLGQWQQTVTPSGQTIGYVWLNGKINAITVNGQTLISQISYEPDDQINGWTWGNGQQHERFYDLAGRPVLASLGFNAAQLPNSRHYGYDAAGRLIQTTDDSDPGLNQQYAYDGLDRLTGSERGEPAQTRVDYSYDLNGNRTGKVVDNTTTYHYDISAGSNRLQSQSGAQSITYSYDPMGLLLSDGTFSYGYNPEGRRTSVTGAGLTVSYGYNPLGQRVKKNVIGGPFTRYFYDEQGHLAGEYTASGQLIQEIVWLGDLPIAVLKPGATTPDLYYIHADTLGTPRQISRPGDNKVVWAWESEAFGASLPNQNPSGLGTFVFNLRFPGQYYDAETGLHYNYFRDYDPRTGRYIQSDPIGLAGGLNTYAYVNGNPVNAIDPDGRIAQVFWPLVVAMIEMYELQQAADGVPAGAGRVCLIAKGAGNVNAGVALNRKLSALEGAQQNAAKFRQLPDGRTRYYEAERAARNPGPTRGSSYVTEYNPANGNVRSWNEAYDQIGNVNRVHPKMINGQTANSQHYPPTARELGLH